MFLHLEHTAKKSRALTSYITNSIRYLLLKNHSRATVFLHLEHTAKMKKLLTHEITSALQCFCTFHFHGADRKNVWGKRKKCTLTLFLVLRYFCTFDFCFEVHWGFSLLGMRRFSYTIIGLWKSPPSHMISLLCFRKKNLSPACQVIYCIQTTTSETTRIKARNSSTQKLVYLLPITKL